MVFLEPILLAIAGKMNSSDDEVTLTTAEIGRILGVSQQTASRYAAALETRGWVERKKTGRVLRLKLTPEGVDVLCGIHGGLSRLLETEPVKSFYGFIASGIGEGAYYIKEYAEKIESAVGYRPYYGTLNIHFKTTKPNLKPYSDITINPFKSGDRSFGAVYLTQITLKVRGRKIDCHVIIPERTHHKTDLELIAPHNLRRTYRLRDGDKATITIKRQRNVT